MTQDDLPLHRPTQGAMARALALSNTGSLPGWLLRLAARSPQRGATTVADITYIPSREGWLYLAAVEDLYSRRVVGWAMAVQRRLPDEGLLAHSDRGSQYASDPYQRLLAKHGIRCSMSRRAGCWDNAPMESCFALLKNLFTLNQYMARAHAPRSSRFPSFLLELTTAGFSDFGEEKLQISPEFVRVFHCDTELDIS